MFHHSASVVTYSLNEYTKDISGYNVTHAVHVEACWPGDPVGETKSDHLKSKLPSPSSLALPFPPLSFLF